MVRTEERLPKAVTTKSPPTSPASKSPAVTRTPNASVPRCGLDAAGRRSAPPSRRRSVSIITIGGKRLSTITFMATPATTDIVDPHLSPVIIHRESSPAMQTPHPIDVEIDEMDQTHRVLIRHFASDGQIDENERSILDRFLDHYTDIAGYRRREVAADAFKRNGATDLTGRRFADAGFGLVDLDAERQKRPGANVISFPSNRNIG